MLPLLVIVLIVFWASVAIVDHLLLSFPGTKRRYMTFLRRFGLQISWGQLAFYTTVFNGVFHRIGQSRKDLWHLWFILGTGLTLITGLVSIVSLCILPIKIILEIGRKTEAKDLSIQPLIPGINVPLEQLGHFLLALIICTVFHELGHAIAAAVENVRVNGCGGFFFIFYPGAYVDLNDEQVQMLSCLKQLKIFCAGVYHNVLLLIFALLFLQVHPVFLGQFYTQSANVYRVTKNSPLYHQLPSYSTIYSIDHCPVNTLGDWRKCLQTIEDQHPLESKGYCLSSNEIASLSHGRGPSTNYPEDCCDGSSSKDFCFLSQSENVEKHRPPMGHCLPAREVMKYSRCVQGKDCPLNQLCLRPLSIDNRTRLIPIEHSAGPMIIYVGTVMELSQSIVLQAYQSHSSYLPMFFVSDLSLVVQYIVAFSFALAVFNAVPCYALDGQYILSILFEEFSLSRYVRVVLRLGTGLLIVNISLAMIAYFSNSMIESSSSHLSMRKRTYDGDLVHTIN